jgi:hypothetical protein
MIRCVIHAVVTVRGLIGSMVNEVMIDVRGLQRGRELVG